MNRPQSPTPTDWELMLLKVLWNSGPKKADEIREILRGQGIERSDSSIRTILRTMDDKGWVRITQQGKAGVYHANVDRKNMEKKIFNHITHVLFDGDTEGFALRAFETTDLDENVIEKMQEILDRQRKKNIIEEPMEGSEGIR